MKPAAGHGAAPPIKMVGKRVAIVCARFHSDLADWLEAGALRALDAYGIASCDRRLVNVPGCFELPLAARKAIDAGVDAVVALGIVIRGQTPHFDYVAGECARGLMSVQLDARVPIGFGVLTTNTLEQARERADPAGGDKGYEAAVAALTMVALH